VINALKVGAGDSIVVFGTGGVGLSAIMAARLVGAERIIAIDVLPARLALARELGATDALNPGEGDIVKAVHRLVPGGVDFALNTTSVPEIYTQQLECLSVRGTGAFVTSPRGGEWKPPMFHLLSGGRKLQGIVGGDAAPQTFIPMLIDYYRQGRFPFDRLIRFYAFKDIAAAFQDMQRGDTIKPVLRFEPCERRAIAWSK
jgi:aryl-alcohol dehydrogenase